MELEKQPPVGIFTREWELLSAVPARRRRYLELGAVERLLPPAFAVLYVTVLVVRLTA